MRLWAIIMGPSKTHIQVVGEDNVEAVLSKEVDHIDEAAHH